MMKWGKKKKASIASSSSTTSSSSHSHLISHVFPRSWLSKFKLSSEKPGSIVTKNKPNDMKKQNLERWSPRASSLPRNSGYYKDEDGFRRVSFGDDDDNMGFGGKFAVSSQPYCGNCKTNVKEVARNRRIVQEPKKVPREMIEREKERVAKEEILKRTYNRIVEATEELHRELDEVDGYRKSVEKDLSEKELLEVMQMVGRAEERPASISTSKSPTSWQELKDAKMKQVLLKNEKQRKSFHISREVSKVKVRSPRTPSKTETCKIRALEDMKRAKLKKKAKEIEQEEQEKTLGSFAVVKRSHDPQRDFKESMVEMIIEKRITRPDELEELLACYLTLNADEYHDLIVEVFRQVWCELEQSYS